MQPTSQNSFVRDRYRLQEAAEKCNCDVEDLIYLAASGDLQIFVLADNWTASEIYEDDLQWNPKDGLNVSGMSAMPDFESVNFEEQWKNYEGADMKVGPLTRYGKRGALGFAYQKQWSGPQPVAKESFRKFRDGNNLAVIELDFNRMIKPDHPIDQKRRFLVPESEIGVRDALAQGLFFVKGEALMALAGKEDQGDGIKAKVPKVDKGVYISTLQKIVAGLAVHDYGYDPSALRSDVPTKIRISLESEGINLHVDTIREALKQAAKELPQD